MREKVELEDIEWIINKGSQYIIPERKEEWEAFCRLECKDKNSISMCLELLSVMRMLHVGTPADVVVKEFDVDRYPAAILEWFGKSVARFSSDGILFAKNSRMPSDEEFRLELKQINEENQKFQSQVNRFKR